MSKCAEHQKEIHDCMKTHELEECAKYAQGQYAGYEIKIKELEAERDRYKEALKTIEALNHSGHYIEGEPGEHENKGCLASDLAQSALAQMEEP